MSEDIDPVIAQSNEQFIPILERAIGRPLTGPERVAVRSNRTATAFLLMERALKMDPQSAPTRATAFLAELVSAFNPTGATEDGPISAGRETSLEVAARGSGAPPRVEERTSLIPDASNTADRTTTVTSIHNLALRGDLEGVKRLIENGEPLDSTDEQGRSALHCAAGHGHLEIVKLLLRAGVDPCRKDIRGDLAADLAHRGGHAETETFISQLLNSYEMSEGGDTLDVRFRIEVVDAGLCLATARHAVARALSAGKHSKVVMWLDSVPPTSEVIGELTLLRQCVVERHHGALHVGNTGPVWRQLLEITKLSRLFPEVPVSRDDSSRALASSGTGSGELPDTHRVIQPAKPWWRFW